MGPLLALVLERPGYGYGLAQRLSWRLGETWRLDPKSVYGLLDRLEAEGLVRREVPDRASASQRQQRVMYYPSESAEEWRREWMLRPVRRESTRSELLAKMAGARPGDEELVLAALDEHERDLIRLLEAYGEEQRPADTGLRGLMLAAVDDDICTLLQADREWVVRTRRRLLEFMEHRTP